MELKPEKRSSKIQAEIEIKGAVPGAIERIAELHADYYGQNWGFGAFFKNKITTGVATFLGRFDSHRDRLWTVCVQGRVEGAIAIDGIHAETEGAHLRWFILGENLRGRGLGNRLLAEAIGFCRERGYARIYLWTFEGLLASRHLYEKFGFSLVESRPGSQWGKEMTEQKLVLDLGA